MSHSSLKELSRDELEERVEALEEQLDALNQLVEIRGVEKPSDADVSDIWIAGHPIGKMLDNTKRRSQKNRDRVEELETADTGVSGADGIKARDAMLPLHLMYVDIRDGRGENHSANQRRAAKLFRRFIRKACDEPDTRVSTAMGRTSSRPTGRRRSSKPMTSSRPVASRRHSTACSSRRSGTRSAKSVTVAAWTRVTTAC